MANPEYVRDSFDIDMIRPHDWAIVSRMRPGGKIEVALDEMGLTGTGILQSIEPCPEVREGDGRVVLATVTHANSYIHRLGFEGSGIELELTDRHRLYSITRNDWIATEHLEPGEALQTEYGVIVLSENVCLRGTQTVYNLQVETDECYYVSEERVLSHNTNPCGAGGNSGSQIWSSTSRLTSTENALSHWNKHSSEFPEYENAKQYVEGAKNFLHNSPQGTLKKTRANGDVLKYDPSTNTFGVMDASGIPRTMFRPANGLQYWQRQ